MSSFANLVRDRLATAVRDGSLASPGRSLEGDVGSEAIQSGLELVQRLSQTNVVCQQEADCKEVAVVLQVAGRGTAADKRTALTRLQRLLANLTAADSDVAGDVHVQQFRRDLHLALDH